MDATVRKYLSGHEAPECKLALPLLAGERSWAHVLVVPVHAESPAFLEGLRPAFSAARGHGLVVAVVNGRREDPSEHRARDLSLLAAWREGAERLEVGPHLAWLRGEGAFDLLVVDRASDDRAFAPGEGVGLARKIGSDLALALWATRAIRRAWIHGTDADVSLPRAYFDALPTDPGVAASLAPFVHVAGGDAAVDRATLAYEMRLRWYVQGLRWSGSAHAHHSIGSTISVRPGAYAAVRGFPRREAGEDFYLLDKISKLGRIQTRAGPPIFIRARRSDRVPFGTGPAVEAALRGEAIEVYDPAIFEALMRLHGALAALARDGDANAFERVCDEAHLGEGLRTLGLDRSLPAALAGARPRDRSRRLREHFDGLKTLRLVHVLRDLRWPSGPLEDLWDRAEFLGDGRRAEGSFEARLAYLRRREGIERAL